VVASVVAEFFFYGYPSSLGAAITLVLAAGGGLKKKAAAPVQGCLIPIQNKDSLIYLNALCLNLQPGSSPLSLNAQNQSNRPNS
jgi:hypothetical protein